MSEIRDALISGEGQEAEVIVDKKKERKSSKPSMIRLCLIDKYR